MPQKLVTTITLMDNELVLYRRERSSIWQCRYKVDGQWQRATTKERDEAKARLKARELMIEAEIRKRSNLPVINRKFRQIAKLAIDRMKNEQAAGQGKVSFSDYERVIEDYLIPFFGNHNIGNVDHALVAEFDQWRITKMGRAPSQSTLMTQNAALTRVFDEAVVRGLMTTSNRPKLTAKGKASKRRPAFSLVEVRALQGNFESWVARGRTEQSRELRALMRDYVEVLLDTGARPGVELLDLKWRQVQYEQRPTITPTDTLDEDGEAIDLVNQNRSCLMWVDGKTGGREIAGMLSTVKAFERIIKRNYGKENPISDPFKGIAVPTNNDYVFTTKDKIRPTSFQKMFEQYLEEHNLLVDPVTGQKRVFYSLRHTYATMGLEHDLVPLATLTVQMGTSVTMIERHYSHLKIRNAIEQLRRYETRRLLQIGGKIDDMYKFRSK